MLLMTMVLSCGTSARTKLKKVRKEMLDKHLTKKNAREVWRGRNKLSLYSKEMEWQVPSTDERQVSPSVSVFQTSAPCGHPVLSWRSLWLTSTKNTQMPQNKWTSWARPLWLWSKCCGLSNWLFTTTINCTRPNIQVPSSRRADVASTCWEDWAPSVSAGPFSRYSMILLWCGGKVESKDTNRRKLY